MNVDLTPAMDLPISKLSVLRTEAKKFKEFYRRLDSMSFLLGLTSGASRFLWPGEKFWPLSMTVLKQVTNEMTPSVNLGLRVSLVPS